jgi:hypothetical protein
MNNTQLEKGEKLLRVWSERKKAEIAIRVQYLIAEEGGCKLYTLLSREECT